MEAAHISDEEFETMLEKVRAREADVQKLDKDTKLKIYSLGKQGKFGDNNEPKPGMLAVKEKAKWDAWTAHKGMDKHVARSQFAEVAKAFL